MKYTILLLIPLIASCASTGVIQTGENTYIISKKSAGGGFVSGNGAKADLYKEANEFCRSKEMFVETIKASTVSGIPFVRIAGAELEFKCVKSSKDST